MVARWFLTTCALALLIGLTACGFQLKTDAAIPFRNLFISATPNSPLAANLNQRLIAANTPPTADATQAQARLSLTDEARDKVILSLSGAGKVREFQLKLRVAYTLTAPNGQVLIARTESNLTRILSFDDAQVLAKQQEEALLFQDMENDVAQQILRRLAQVKPAG